MIWLCLNSKTYGQTQPGQPQSGYGGADYLHHAVTQLRFDNGITPGGFYIYLPTAPGPESAPVVVFSHGFLGYNPGVYGKWIEHLVRRGNVVVFVRYQINPFALPATFTPNAVTAVQNALDTLAAHPELTRPDLQKVVYVGHSYGGVVTANLAVNWRQYGIPEPKGIVLAAPGTGGFDSGRLASYAAMDSTINVLTIAEKNDSVVDSVFALEVFHSTKNIPITHKNLVFHHEDLYGTPFILANHNEATCPDSTYDNGAYDTPIETSDDRKLDAVDYYVYWKLTDALMDCARSGTGCTTAFGGAPEQRYTGFWSDGSPVHPLEIRLNASPAPVYPPDQSAPDEMATLFPGYPDPARDRVTISFVLSRSAPVRLEVFDSLGRSVQLLAHAVLPSGSHQVEWDLSGLTGGIYIYRLTAGSWTQTKTMRVVR